MATQEKRDYYELLGVNRSVDEQGLKSAYRKLAMKYHPDKNPDDPDAEIKFKEVSEAYEVLRDPQKRAAYDRFGHAAFDGRMGGGNAGPGFGTDFASAMSDIFDEFFGGARGSARSGAGGRQRGSDLRYNLEIDLEDAFHGKTVEINVPTSAPCEVCEGSGARPGTSPVTCPTCSGAGRIRVAQGFFTLERTCVACQGRGKGGARTVRHLRWRWARGTGSRALGQHSRRHRGRNADPPLRRGRGRADGRSFGGSLHLPVHPPARLLPAGGAGPLLPCSHFHGTRGARRVDRGAHHRRRQDQGERSPKPPRRAVSSACGERECPFSARP